MIKGSLTPLVEKQQEQTAELLAIQERLDAGEFVSKESQENFLAAQAETAKQVEEKLEELQQGMQELEDAKTAWAASNPDTEDRVNEKKDFAHSLVNSTEFIEFKDRLGGAAGSGRNEVVVDVDPMSFLNFKAGTPFPGFLSMESTDPALDQIKLEERIGIIPKKENLFDIRSCFRVVPIEASTLTGAYEIWVDDAGVEVQVAPAAQPVGEACLKPIRKKGYKPFECKLEKLADGCQIPEECFEDIIGFEDRVRNDVGAALVRGLTTQVLQSIADNPDTTTIDPTLIGATTIQDCVLAGVTAILENECPAPSKVLVNPRDFARMGIGKDLNEAYYCNPCAGGMFGTSVFGVDVVPTNRVSVGDAWFINSSAGRIRIKNRSSNIRMYDQHGENAQYNIIYVQGEIRTCFEFWYPQGVAVGVGLLTAK